MSRGNSHQSSRNSVAGSYSGLSSRSASVAGSRRSSMADFADMSMPGLSEAGALPPLPSLTGQSPAAALPTHALPSISTSNDTHRGLVSKDGIVSAGAFSRATRHDAGERPEFGQVASSSDVPLVQAASASISRPRVSNRNRTSSSTVDTQTASTGSVNGNPSRIAAVRRPT